MKKLEIMKKNESKNANYLRKDGLIYRWCIAFQITNFLQKIESILLEKAFTEEVFKKIKIR